MSFLGNDFAKFHPFCLLVLLQSLLENIFADESFLQKNFPKITILAALSDVYNRNEFVDQTRLFFG